jgi:hypothetical protein
MAREAAVVQPRRGNIFVETVANERGKLRQERHRDECGLCRRLRGLRFVATGRSTKMPLLTELPACLRFHFPHSLFTVGLSANLRVVSGHRPVQTSPYAFARNPVVHALLRDLIVLVSGEAEATDTRRGVDRRWLLPVCPGHHHPVANLFGRQQARPRPGRARLSGLADELDETPRQSAGRNRLQRLAVARHLRQY